MTLKKILMAVGLFFGFSDLVMANWNAFKTAVESSVPQTINFSPNFSLTWQYPLSIGADHIFVGLQGTAIAALLGADSFRGFSAANRTISFYDRWVFYAFRASTGAAIYNVNSTINFTTSTFLFVNNNADFYGGALFIDGGFFDFQRSTVIFQNNKSTNDGGAVNISRNIGAINFTSSTVVFDGNQADGNGGAIYLNIDGSSIVFAHSRASFSNNLLGGAISAGAGLYIDGAAKAYFSNSIVDFSSNKSAGLLSITYGAAISLQGGAKLNVVLSSVSFFGNLAYSYGGAISMTGQGVEAAFENSNISFTSNTAGDGGAVYISNGGKLSFARSKIAFISNQAQSFGGALSIHASDVDFTDSLVEFISNAANIETGAFSLDGGKINFANSTVVFINNRSGVRGKIIFGDHYSSIDFTSSNVIFIENTASVFVSLSSLNFTSSNVSFADNNIAVRNAIISVNAASLNISSSQAAFSSNTSRSRGGSIESSYSNINLINSTINFFGNYSYGYGGAIYAHESNVNFSKSRAAFINNSAGALGGAITAIIRSSISFTADDLQAGGAHQIVFFGNSADGKKNDIHLDESQLWLTGGIWMEGGITAIAKSSISYSGRSWHLGGINDFDDMAMFDIAPGSSVTAAFASWTYRSNSQLTLQNLTFDFINSSVSFIDNKTDGALNVLGGSTLSFNNSIVRFSSNNAANDGGALSIVDAFVFMEGDFEFSNNAALSRGGALFIENSNVFFSAKNAPTRILFKDNSARDGDDVYAIRSFLIFDASNFPIILTNGIRLEGGASIIKTGKRDLIFEGDSSAIAGLEINEGRSVFKSSLSFVRNANVESLGTLSLASGDFNRLIVEVLLSKGALELDIDFSSMSALGDEIISNSGGLVVIENGSFLNVHPINPKTWVYGSSTTIIFTDQNSLSIDIGAVSYDRNIYKLIKTNNSLSIMFMGYLLDFSRLSLTHNQNEAYLFLRKTAELRNSGDYGAFRRWENFDELIKEMNALRDEISFKEKPDEIRRALDSLSGSFLAQTIVHIAADNPSKLLYSKTQPNVDGIPFMSFWADAGAKFSQRDDEKNLLGKFEKALAQASLGFNFINSADMNIGAFASFAAVNMRQGENKAEVQSYEGGLYGGSFSDNFKHKYFAAFAYHDVLSARKIDLGKGYEPKADFALFGVQVGGESLLSLAIFRKLETGLYAGLIGSSIYNDEIKESGGGAIALRIAPNNYQRLDGYAGLRIGRRNWHISAQAGYLVYGNLEKARFGMFISGFEHRMDIEGSNVDPISFALNFGADKKLRKNIYLQTSAGASVDKDLRSKRASINISVKYLFPTKSGAEIYQDIAEKEEAEKLQREIEEREQKRLLKEEDEKRRIEEQEAKRRLQEEIQRQLEQAEQKRLQEQVERKRVEEQERQMRLEQAEQRRKKAKAAYKLRAASFESSRSGLSKEAIEIISIISAEIKRNGYSMITVEGHTDSTGSKTLNMALSEQRAKAVYIELLRLGFPKEKLKIAPFGETLPAADNKTKEGRALNRRVEIFVE